MVQTSGDAKMQMEDAVLPHVFRSEAYAKAQFWSTDYSATWSPIYCTLNLDLSLTFSAMFCV